MLHSSYEAEDRKAPQATLARRPHQADVAQDPQGQQEAQVEPYFPSFEEACEANVAAKDHYGQPAVLGWGNGAENGIRSALEAPQSHYFGMFGQLPEEAHPDDTQRMIEAGAKLGYHMGESQGFDDGNKRTARALVEAFFENNGLHHIIPEGHDDEEYADHLKGYGVVQEDGSKRHELQHTIDMFKQRHAQGGPNPNYEPYPDDDENFGGTHTANILDPIHDSLDPQVWDNPVAAQPTLKPEHSGFLYEKIITTLSEHGYEGMERWLSLVFTGSLTTFQYSDDSDVDISLFIDAEVFPEWSRAEMIGVMVENIDGTKLPGTPHPIQIFVVAQGIAMEDLYKPGLRSGYNLSTDTWIVPPERHRVHDVEKEMNASYVLALENADKMERLLRYEPDKAVTFWHQIHKRRQTDQRNGRGDYSPSNITYKMLANRGLFPQISEISGEYIP